MRKSQKCQVNDTIRLDFGKDKTAILKGIAIIMMVVLHCCCGPGWYDRTIPAMENQSFVDFINGSLKMCVGLYAFLVGFGYSFSKKRNLKYSLNHIWKLLLPYWIILLLFSLPFGYKNIGGGLFEVMLNMLGLSGSLSWVNWFVYFYIFQMITLPFLTRVIDTKPIHLTLLCIAGFIGIKVLMKILHLESNLWTDALSACCIYSPIVLEGYLFGRMNWFTRIKLPVHWGLAVVACTTVLCLPALRLLGPYFLLEWVLVPLMITAVLYLFTAFKLPICAKVLSSLGGVSVYMWFFHALFFTRSIRWFWQRFILLSDNIIIITLWTLLLTFVCSWGLKFFVDRVIKMYAKG